MDINREVESSPLNEPHFDEEATLLSAKPVVPLEVVRAKARSGHRLTLGLVATVALLIGAFGATLIYKLRSPQQPTEISEADESGQPVSPVIESGATGIDGSPRVQPAQENQPVRAETVQTVAAKPQLRVSKKDRALEQRAARDQEMANRREQERRERWEERRPRRVRHDEKEAWRREERRDERRDARAHTEAWRIREIFEGVRRP